MARVAIINMIVATEKLPINNIIATQNDQPIPAIPRHRYLKKNAKLNQICCVVPIGRINSVINYKYYGKIQRGVLNLSLPLFSKS